MTDVILPSYILQSSVARTVEIRVFAWLKELEKQGIVRQDFQDSFTILDPVRYVKACNERTS